MLVLQRNEMVHRPRLRAPVERAETPHRPALTAASGCAPPIGAWRLGVWYSGLAVLLVVDSTGSDGQAASVPQSSQGERLNLCRSKTRFSGWRVLPPAAWSAWCFVGWVLLKIVYWLTCRILGLVVLLFRGDGSRATGVAARERRAPPRCPGSSHADS